MIKEQIRGMIYYHDIFIIIHSKIVSTHFRDYLYMTTSYLDL
jgi:hypothetical protein